jgi:glycosyltransferase involved in cell wall biosynthesis
MNFCMITTFFGPMSFGGDAAYVDRLARALVRRGHAVEVIHCADAFAVVGGDENERPYKPPPDVRIHTLRSRLGRLSPLWTHQSGGPGTKARAIRTVLGSTDFDVIHFHNISLVGGPRVLNVGGASPNAVRLLTAHEHWLVCPMHHLWKLGREICERPQCLRCTLHGRRPPQLWRYTRMRERMLDEVDAIAFPSRHALEVHRARGVEGRLVELPYFLPDEWSDALDPNGQAAPAPPYVAAAGRFVQPKGYQDLLAAIARLPDVELRIAGGGPYEPELRRRAAGLPNVRFLGILDAGDLAKLFRDAIAVVIPSLSYETFGYVALEAFSVETPVIARRLGALEEIVEKSAAGLLFDSTDELVESIQRLAREPGLRDELGRRGREAVTTIWSEDAQVDAYVRLVHALAEARRVTARARASAIPAAEA